jgi:hypothetical protein
MDSKNQVSPIFMLKFYKIAVISSYIKKERDYQLKCQEERDQGDLPSDFF